MCTVCAGGGKGLGLVSSRKHGHLLPYQSAFEMQSFPVKECIGDHNCGLTSKQPTPHNPSVLSSTTLKSGWQLPVVIDGSAESSNAAIDSWYDAASCRERASIHRSMHARLRHLRIDPDYHHPGVRLSPVQQPRARPTFRRRQHSVTQRRRRGVPEVVAFSSACDLSLASRAVRFEKIHYNCHMVINSHG
jgi:hypothetical protein